MMKGEAGPVYPSHFLAALEMPCMHRAQDPPAQAAIVEEDPAGIQARPPSNLRRPRRAAPQGTRCRRSVQGSLQVGHRARSPFMQSWLRFSHTSLRMIRLRPYASTDQFAHRRPCSKVLRDGLNAFDIFASSPYTALKDLRRIGRTYPHAPR